MRPERKREIVEVVITSVILGVFIILVSIFNMETP